jgi:ABC exporter DevB family membrane fusion protein
MKRYIIGAAVIGLGAINYAVLAERREPAAAPVAVESHVLAAAPGRVEARSEEIRVSAQVGGRLQAVLVEENDRVKTGQVIAVVENVDYRARVASAEASLRLREAEALRVHNGARDQERKDAAAALREAEAVLDNAKTDESRRRGLFNEAVIARAEMDAADEQLKVAQARTDSARERLSLLEAGSRDEDRAQADAQVALARASLEEARAVLEKTFIRSPIDGIVLRKHHHAGESVSTQFDSPIVTLADRSSIRVRVDVDEADVANLHDGEPAYVTADAFGDRRFPGHVIRVGQVLGRKNVRTDEPTERVDTKILETLIQLDDAHELPLGLRVQAFIGK